MDYVILGKSVMLSTCIVTIMRGTSLCQLVYVPPINTDSKESDSDINSHDKSNNKKRNSNRISRNNAAKASEMETKKSARGSLILIAHVVQENQLSQEEDENLVISDNNGMQ
eukprot:7560413-Ditylum_brightwellii.AAC.1